MELIANNITKTIKGNTILDNISLKFAGGRVYGFTGRNGSGKTMLFRALSGLMKLSSGEIYYDRKLLGKDFSVLPSLGIVLENVNLYPELTGMENLKYLAGFKKIAGEREIRGALERVGLLPEDKRTYKKYSLGMRQRLAIAQAVMERPDVIMLDEPTNGLDTEGVDLIRKIIMDEKARGAIILLASHNSEDIRYLSDVVYRIEKGAVSARMEQAEEV